MTLVVSDISRFGIVMVGDSAVTTAAGVETGAVKVQYAQNANIGFALWGDARVDNRRLDYWLDDFIRDEVKTGDSVEQTGQKLVTALNTVLSTTGRSWADMIRGIHIAGYRNGLPLLFHAHCGHPHEQPHELRLYRDFPDGKNWSEDQFRKILQAGGFAHLRNGYHQHFAALFDNALNYSEQLKAMMGVQFPHPSLEGRFEFYKTLVRFVAGVLVASKAAPRVNDTLSSIAFDSGGIALNERLPWPSSPAILGTCARFSREARTELNFFARAEQPMSTIARVIVTDR